MKNRTAWIAIVLALGLVLGAVVTTTGAIDGSPAASDLDTALAAAARVDCGEGREALLEPIFVNGESSFRVRCVPAEDTPTPADAPAPARAASPVVVVASPTSPAPQTASGPGRSSDEGAHDPNADRRAGDERSWKESAVVIGGAAGTGAGIGALAKGKKGAAVGAAIGAASGAAYELIRKDRQR